MSDGTQSFSYDENGRLISAGDRSYSYALNDRLIALSQPGLSTTFAYNGDGVRLAQTENGSQTRYLVDTQRRYSEVVGAITPESETWYLLGLDILGQQQGSDWSYYAYDGLGSVRLALDSSGSPSAGMRYEPYGQPAASWGTPPALGFTGEWTDSSGLLYLRARYLDPSSATFLSRDPFEGLPTRALSRNGYSWVEGNPINYVDPSGLCIVSNQIFRKRGMTDCERFIEELRGITATFMQEIRRPQPIHILGIPLFSISAADLLDRDTLINMYAAFLGQIYAGIPFSIGGIPFFGRPGSGGIERYGLPNREEFAPGDEWRNPMFYKDQPADSLRQSYGFRRPYFGNTHHYFAFLKYALELPELTGTVNYERELNQLHRFYDETQAVLLDPETEDSDKVQYRNRYAWLYLDGVNDLYITDHAIQAAKVMRANGIMALPAFLYREMCAHSEADVWSLDTTISSYYFRLPQELWPDSSYWP